MPKLLTVDDVVHSETPVDIILTNEKEKPVETPKTTRELLSAIAYALRLQEADIRTKPNEIYEREILLLEYVADGSHGWKADFSAHHKEQFLCTSIKPGAALRMDKLTTDNRTITSITYNPSAVDKANNPKSNVRESQIMIITPAGRDKRKIPNTALVQYREVRANGDIEVLPITELELSQNQDMQSGVQINLPQQQDTHREVVSTLV